MGPHSVSSLGLAFLTQRFSVDSSKSLCASPVHLSSLLTSCFSVCWTIHLLQDIWADSRLCLWQRKLLQIFMHRSLCEHSSHWSGSYIPGEFSWDLSIGLIKFSSKSQQRLVLRIRWSNNCLNDQMFYKSPEKNVLWHTPVCLLYLLPSWCFKVHTLVSLFPSEGLPLAKLCKGVCQWQFLLVFPYMSIISVPFHFSGIVSPDIELAIDNFFF